MKRLAIVGMGNSRTTAPFDNKEFEIWGLNHHYKHYPRFDKWFDLHSHIDNVNKEYKQFLINNKDKVVTMKPVSFLNNNEIFPLDKVIQLVGGKYFNNSISYMIAYALLNGYKDIGLYGVDLLSSTEIRTKQKQNVREIIFFAKGIGVNICTSNITLMEEYPLYGQ